eukprot:766384-Hanusia_phi.AAC.3
MDSDSLSACPPSLSLLLSKLPRVRGKYVTSQAPVIVPEFYWARGLPLGIPSSGPDPPGPV